MGATAISAGSSISFDEQQLIIRLSRKLFTPWRWEVVTSLIQSLQQSMAGVKTDDSAPKGTGLPMGQIMRRPWRHLPLDVLSLVLYMLLIPTNHFLVRLDLELDLSFVDEECADCYKWKPGKPGRPPWPAQLMFRLLLLMFLFAVPYETQLVLELQANLLWRWFIGLGVLEKGPDHSTLHTFRKRLGPERFVRILACILSLCQERGLIGNEDLYFDFTAVYASAVAFTPYQRSLLLALALNRYLDLLEARQAFDQPLLETLRGLVIEVALEAVGSKSLEKVSPEQLGKSMARLEEKVAGMPQGPRWQEPMEKVVEEAATTEAPPSDRKGLLKLAKRLLAVLPQARGDLDARLGKVSNWEFCFGYLAGYVIDGLFGIITAVVLATANAWQAAFLSPALHQHQAHVSGKANSMTTDSAFDFSEVYQMLDEADIKGYIASRDHRGPKGCFGPECFTWKEGCLFCSNEQPMVAVKTHSDDKVTYQGQECATCGLREQCIGQEAQKPRTITVHPAHHCRWQENRVANRSEEHKQAQKRRLAWENVFGHGNTYHHGDKAPYRSQPMNDIAQVMTVIALNLEKMVRYGHRKRPLQAGTSA